MNAHVDESTAATRGLPPALVKLKAGLEAAHSGLPRENSGSRWPKITLGVLGDARRLLPDQLDRLNALCACACFATLVGLDAMSGHCWARCVFLCLTALCARMLPSLGLMALVLRCWAMMHASAPCLICCSA